MEPVLWSPWISLQMKNSHRTVIVSLGSSGLAYESFCGWHEEKCLLFQSCVLGVKQWHRHLKFHTSFPEVLISFAFVHALGKRAGTGFGPQYS